MTTQTIEQILTRQNKELREQIETLQEEIRQLKLMLAPDVMMPAGLPNFTPRETEIMRMLLARDKVRQSALKTLIPNYIDDADNYLKVYICKIRNKITPAGYGIRNFKGEAYALIYPLDAATKSVA